MVVYHGRPSNFEFYVLANIKEWELSQLAVRDSYVYQVCMLPGDIGNEPQLCEGARSHFQVLYVRKSKTFKKTNNLGLLFIHHIRDQLPENSDTGYAHYLRDLNQKPRESELGSSRHSKGHCCSSQSRHRSHGLESSNHPLPPMASP